MHVCGAVNQPGVYELTADSRLFEAIQMAGGLTEEAADQTLNQAEVIEDGSKIYVDLNRASVEELMTLSGIGQSRAEAIVRYREEHGAFQKIEDLMEVEGIKEGVFQKVKDQIKI